MLLLPLNPLPPARSSTGALHMAHLPLSLSLLPERRVAMLCQHRELTSYPRMYCQRLRKMPRSFDLHP